MQHRFTSALERAIHVTFFGSLHLRPTQWRLDSIGFHTPTPNFASILPIWRRSEAIYLFDAFGQGVFRTKTFHVQPPISVIHRYTNHPIDPIVAIAATVSVHLGGCVPHTNSIVTIVEPTAAIPTIASTIATASIRLT